MNEEKINMDVVEDLFETSDKLEDVKEAMSSCDDLEYDDHCEHAYRRFQCVKKALKEKDLDIEDL